MLMRIFLASRRNPVLRKAIGTESERTGLARAMVAILIGADSLVVIVCVGMTGRSRCCIADSTQRALDLCRSGISRIGRCGAAGDNHAFS